MNIIMNSSMAKCTFGASATTTATITTTTRTITAATTTAAAVEVAVSGAGGSTTNNADLKLAKSEVLRYGPVASIQNASLPSVLPDPHTEFSAALTETMAQVIPFQMNISAAAFMQPIFCASGPIYPQQQQQIKLNENIMATPPINNNNPAAINVLMTGTGNTSGSTIGITTPTTLSTLPPSLAVMPTNAALGNSLLIRNQPYFATNPAIATNTALASMLGQRTTSASNLSFLNRDLVKQIVIGNPKTAAATVSAPAMLPETTLLQNTKQQQQPLQKSKDQKSTRKPFCSIYSKQPQAPSLAEHKEKTNNEIVGGDSFTTTTVSTISSSGETTNSASNMLTLDTTKTCHQNDLINDQAKKQQKTTTTLAKIAPKPIPTNITATATIPNIKTTTTVVTPNATPSIMTHTSVASKNNKKLLPTQTGNVDNDFPMPELVHKMKTMNVASHHQIVTASNEPSRKQESLLKVKSIQPQQQQQETDVCITSMKEVRITSSTITSPRTQRSKSLNLATNKNNTDNSETERRKSIASEVKVYKMTTKSLEHIKAMDEISRTCMRDTGTAIKNQTNCKDTMGIVILDEYDEVDRVDQLELDECEGEEEFLDSSWEEEKSDAAPEMIVPDDADAIKMANGSEDDEKPIVAAAAEVSKNENDDQYKMVTKIKDEKADDVINVENELANIVPIHVKQETPEIREHVIVKKNAYKKRKISPLATTTTTIEIAKLSDDDDGGKKQLKYKPHTSPSSQQTDTSSVLCDEQLLSSASTTSSTSPSRSASKRSKSSGVASAGVGATKTSKASKIKVSSSLFASGGSFNLPEVNSYSSVLQMLSTFNMLTWKERIGTARGTSLRFHLNEFNLFEIHERCPPRSDTRVDYEKPIYDRITLPQKKNATNDDALPYLCRRCSCHGIAEDFLAPEFCSLECLRRDTRKRPRDSAVNVVIKKRPRKDTLNVPAVMTAPNYSNNNNNSNNTGSSNDNNRLKKRFRWSSYVVGKSTIIAAPIDLFLNPFPTGPNLFKLGMKVEAIDPENCALICVCTVIDMQGYRLKLAFDGYDSIYDYWVNADSMDIFPPGWCSKTGRSLQPPKGIEASKFSWPTYLAKSKATPAQRNLFTHLNSPESGNPFKIGMHLEAEDLNDTGKLCVASVADVLNDRLRIHFDGWEEYYDYWVDISSPYIHPCGYHEGRQQLIVPPDYENASFNWSDYIKSRCRGEPAGEELFASREPINYAVNMKLEVVDPRNPSLIRPATVVGRKGHRIKLHLDGWPSDYCFWLEDDSPDLHPIGWCDVTGHDLEPPPGYQMRTVKTSCSIIGCRGIGNAKDLRLNTHAARDCCPYAPENWRHKVQNPPRIDISKKKESSSPKLTEAQQQRQHIQNVHMKISGIGGMNKTHQHHVSHTTKTPADYARSQRRNAASNALKNYSDNCDAPIAKLQTIKTECCETIIIPGDEEEQAACSQFKTPLATASTAGPTLVGPPPVSLLPSSEIATATATAIEPATITNGVVQPVVDPRIHIAKRFLYDYGPRLQQNYDIWQKNLAFNMSLIRHNPMLWSVAETSAYVEGILNCSETTAIFSNEDIDGAALLLMQQCDLTETLGLKLGPAIKLYSHIIQLRTLAVCKFDVKLNAYDGSAAAASSTAGFTP